MLLELCLGDRSFVRTVARPVIATMFRFTGELLLRQSRPLEGGKPEIKSYIDAKLCDSCGVNCVGGQQ